MNVERTIDDLGRVCIPKSIRESHGLTCGSTVKFITDNKNRLILANAEDVCALCSAPASVEIKGGNVHLCKGCATALKEGMKDD